MESPRDCKVLDIGFISFAIAFHIFECPGWKQMPVQAFGYSI